MTLLPATVNGQKTYEVNCARKAAFEKARNGELSFDEEIELLLNMIITKSEDGIPTFEVPFRISNKAYEVITSKLYVAYRTDFKTIIELVSIRHLKAYEVKFAREEALKNAQNGKISFEEEIELLISMINTKKDDGEFYFEVPFCVSIRAYEIIYSFGYGVDRNDNYTTIKMF